MSNVSDETKTGATTAAAVTVNEPGAGNRLAGPGTGRAVSQPADARVERHTSYDPADFPVLTGREEEWRFTRASAGWLTARPVPGPARRLPAPGSFTVTAAAVVAPVLVSSDTLDITVPLLVL